jgi:hypothetical protein
MDVSDVIYIPDIPGQSGFLPGLDLGNMQHLTSYVSAPRRRRQDPKLIETLHPKKRPPKNFLLTRLAARSLLETLSLTHYILDRVLEPPQEPNIKPALKHIL